MKELKDEGELQCRYVSAINNAANIFTKPLLAANFSREKRLIGSHWLVSA